MTKSLICNKEKNESINDILHSKTTRNINLVYFIHQRALCCKILNHINICIYLGIKYR